ncbi:MAG: glycosyltransferase family 4 protein [Acidobacteriota bacterium]
MTNTVMTQDDRCSKAALRLMAITTVDATMGTFFEQQLRDLAAEGFEIHAVSSPGPRLDRIAMRSNQAGGSITTHAVPMERQPNPTRDLVSLWNLYRLMRKVRPHVVHVHTPKAGLLGSIAARLCGVKIRMYTIHGLPLETRQGLWRTVLEGFERTTCRLSTRVYAVSPSLEKVARDLRLCSSNKLSTLGDGSCSGIDLKRFDSRSIRPEAGRRGAGDRLRSELGIPSDATVICFVGRIVRDKGIEVLADAWRSLEVHFPELRLILCGPEETADAASETSKKFLYGHPRVRKIERKGDEMPAVYAASDLCVLPTYREGLPQVALEAGAMGLPVVGTKVTGVVDAVEHGTTGMLVAAGNAAELAEALAQLVSDEGLRRTMGTAAREYVSSRFSSTRVNQLWVNEYRSRIREQFADIQVASEAASIATGAGRS